MLKIDNLVNKIGMNAIRKFIHYQILRVDKLVMTNELMQSECLSFTSINYKKANII